MLSTYVPGWCFPTGKQPGTYGGPATSAGNILIAWMVATLDCCCAGTRWLTMVLCAMHSVTHKHLHCQTAEHCTAQQIILKQKVQVEAALRAFKVVLRVMMCAGCSHSHG